MTAEEKAIREFLKSKQGKGVAKSGALLIFNLQELEQLLEHYHLSKLPTDEEIEEMFPIPSTLSPALAKIKFKRQGARALRDKLNEKK